MISRLNPTLAYLIGSASVLTGLGLGLLWTPADRLLLNPYRYASVSQICELQGEKTLLGGEFATTRWDETVAGTVDIYSLCDTPYHSFPIPSLYPTAMFMLAILVSLIAVLVIWFRGKSQSQSLLVLPILFTLVSGIGIWQHSAMTEGNSKSHALSMASGYVQWGQGWSEPKLRDQLACCEPNPEFTNSDIDYALEHLKVDWSQQAYKEARHYQAIYPDMTMPVIQSSLLRDGFELSHIQIALTIIQLEDKKN